MQIKSKNNKQNNRNERPKSGEIWMCNLGTDKGSVQSGYRPVFIASNDRNNAHSRTVNIIPVTKTANLTKTNKRNLPVHVALQDFKRFGLKMPSTLKVEQITTIDMDTLEKRVGTIADPHILESISRAIKIQFPFMH